MRRTLRALDGIARHVPVGGWPVAMATIFLALHTARASAGDWPQILGPHRNGQADGEHLSLNWGANGPTTVWKRDVGSGFAGVAAVEGKAILFHRQGNELVGEALEARTGRELWKVKFATNYESSISSDNGPRCVPVVSGQQVFLLGPAGELLCVDLASGNRLWYRNVYQEFNAPEGYFGAGSSPIVEEGRLLINVGGRGAGLVALSLSDGTTLWKGTDELASYSSPVAATIDGTRHVVFVTRLNVVSIDPANGAVRFRVPFGSRGPTVNAANPLVLGDHLFVSASYGVGARWLKIGASDATEIWRKDDVMSSQFTTCVEKDGILYGIDGRQDVGRARLRAIEPRTGKIRWTHDDFTTGNLILADGKLLILRTDGQLLLVDPKPDQFRQLAAARLFESTTQALAALSEGLMFARDTHVLKCVDVGQRAMASANACNPSEGNSKGAR